MKRFFLMPALLLAIAGCAMQPTAIPPVMQTNAPAIEPASSTTLSVFSDGAAGGLPSGWTPMVIFKNKKRTDYQLIAHQDKTVMRAHSANASSGLMQRVDIDPQTQPWLHWQWKISNRDGKIAEAQDMMEDAPARIILGFDGDKESLPFAEQILFETAKLLTGHEFPYATLMYEWHANAPRETIKQSKRSSRIRSIVVENGSHGTDAWHEFSRNIVEDFERTYGEKPGKLIGVGILTDSDYSGATVETWYGDVRLLARDAMASQDAPAQSCGDSCTISSMAGAKR